MNVFFVLFFFFENCPKSFFQAFGLDAEAAEILKIPNPLTVRAKHLEMLRVGLRLGHRGLISEVIEACNIIRDFAYRQAFK